MFGYMTNLATVEIDESKTIDIEAEGTRHLYRRKMAQQSSPPVP